MVKIKGKEKEIAAIVIEPARGQHANKDFLMKLRDLCDELGAVLIFDEITSGFRECPGGLHRNLTQSLTHLAVFAKSIKTDIPLGVVIGTEKVILRTHLFRVQIGQMQLGPRRQLRVSTNM